MFCYFNFFFFFSSRRRHTRCSRDWSSDVCSSDLERVAGDQRFLPILQHVALSNKHINHPGMGPYILAEAQPVDSGGVAGTKKAFFAAVERGLYNAADQDRKSVV